MIVEDNSGRNAPDALSREKTADELLRGCVTEAERLADAMTRIDDAVGRALVAGASMVNPGILQAIDLLRQEAESLARVLRIVAEHGSSEATIDDGALSEAVPLGAQRARLMS